MKIRWISEICNTPEETARNIAHCLSLGIPEVSEKERPALAVVGGGPSAVDYVDELKHWPGDVWVSGSAFPWCLSQGIRGTFFTMDQSPQLAKDGALAEKAILSTACDPSVFAVLKDAQVETFKVTTENHYGTTVTAAPLLALRMGYKDVTFYGCDSSYTTQTHAYHDEPVIDLMRVKCGEGSFLTNPGFLLQAHAMAPILRAMGTIFKVKGGGLLAAMIEHQDYDITHGARELYERVIKKAA